VHPLALLAEQADQLDRPAVGAGKRRFGPFSAASEDAVFKAVLGQRRYGLEVRGGAGNDAGNRY